MKKIVILLFGILLFFACYTPKKITQESKNTRWPEFLQEWAADYEIDDAQHLVIIGQIDTLYRLVEDSTLDSELLCSKLCQLQNTISDAIVYDSSLVFHLMMRATARNLYGIIYNNPWFIELGCKCEVLEYLLIDSKWHTSSRENFDLMYTTIMGLSWQAPDRFANLMLTKEDGNELSTAILIVYNYADTSIDNLQISFTDSEGAIIEQLTEKDTYAEVPDAGVKRMMLPPYLVMNALAIGGTITISYDTPQSTLEMKGYPQIHFKEQIENCPRLKEVLIQALK